MYTEFLFLLSDYFKTLRSKLIFFEWLLPVFISLIVYFSIEEKSYLKVANETSSNALTLLGILVGFSITVISLLNTASSKNVEEIKKLITSYNIGGKNISLFQLILINMTYSVIIEILLIIFNLFIPLIWESFEKDTLILMNSFNLFFLLHILLLNLRNMTDFYFILFKK